MFWGARWEWPVLRGRSRGATESSEELSEDGVAASRHYVLIDYENVQPTGLEWLRAGPFKVLVFVGASQSKIPIELAQVVQAMGRDAEYVVLKKGGRNALDFHIAYYIGRLSTQEPGASFLVISNDQGFDPLIEHLQSKGIAAKRSASFSQHPAVEPKIRATFDDQVAKVVTRLAAMKEAKPGTQKTLLSTLHHLFERKLSEPQLSSLFTELCGRGIVKREGTRLSYRLPSVSPRPSSNGHPVARQGSPASVQAVSHSLDAPAELIAAYEKRTKEHIQRVRRCMSVMASVTDYKVLLDARAVTHDASKFGRTEFEPYVWLNEFHRCRQAGEPFEYPAGMEERVREAIRHHVTTNRHHPEFHKDPNDMTEVDLIEMVCDWTAMSQELGQDGGSARGWADRTIGSRIKLNDEKRAFVYRMIDVLDAHLKRET